MTALKMSGLSRHRDLGLLISRVLVGAIMLAHGWQKAFEYTPAGFAPGLADMGVPAPEFMAYVVTAVELVGGACLILGILSRAAAAVLTINLIVAILLVKLKVGFIAPQGGGTGAELDLALIAGFITILFSGPGRYSVDGGDDSS